MSTAETPKRMGDISRPVLYDEISNRVRADEYLDTDFTIREYGIIEGTDFNLISILAVNSDGEVFVIDTTSHVIEDKLKNANDLGVFPILAKVVRVKSKSKFWYFDLV